MIYTLPLIRISPNCFVLAPCLLPISNVFFSPVNLTLFGIMVFQAPFLLVDGDANMSNAIQINIVLKGDIELVMLSY